MNGHQSHIYGFGEFSIDAAKRLLIKGDGEIVALTPKVFETLLYLVEHSGKVIEKDELMREIWTNTIVEESNLSQNISVLRRILGEKHGENRFIATVPGHGYKFVSEVRRIKEEEKDRKGEEKGRKGEEEIKNEAAMSDSSVTSGGLNASELNISDNRLQNESKSEIRNLKSEINQDQKPKTEDRKTNRRWLVALSVLSILALGWAGFYLWRENGKSAAAPIKTIAVLPFKPLVAENRDEALEMGMADTLIARLGDNREIVVRPLSSVRKFGNLEQDALQAGHALEVEAVLDGNLQRWGDKIRVNVRLIKVADGGLLWTETTTKNSPIFSSSRMRFPEKSPPH